MFPRASRSGSWKRSSADVRRLVEPAPFIADGMRRAAAASREPPRRGARLSSGRSPLDSGKGRDELRGIRSRDGAPPESLGTRTAPGLLANPSSGGSRLVGDRHGRGMREGALGRERLRGGRHARMRHARRGRISPPPGRCPRKIRIASGGTPFRTRARTRVEESLTPDFTSATKVKPSTPEAEFSHDVATDTAYYYRVRASSSCNSETSETLRGARVVVLGPSSSRARRGDRRRRIVRAAPQEHLHSGWKQRRDVPRPVEHRPGSRFR